MWTIAGNQRDVVRRALGPLTLALFHTMIHSLNIPLNRRINRRLNLPFSHFVNLPLNLLHQQLDFESSADVTGSLDLPPSIFHLVFH